MPNVTDILKFLQETRGFNYPAYHHEMLVRRVNNRIAKSNTNDIRSYYNMLVTDANEPDLLIENFMINVSHFFRDPLCFEVIAKIIIPDLIAAKLKRNDDTLRIWSAGCSAGEEAYSLAILLNEYLEHEKKSLNIDFFATDSDAGIIKQAKRGEFTAECIREVKFGLVDKYFIESDGNYKVKPGLKTGIQFSVYNLLDKHSYAPAVSVFGDFDLVLCRNVLIYFIPEYQELIFSKLHKSLASKGVLMLGETEAPIANYKEKFRQVCSSCKIFEKR